MSWTVIGLTVPRKLAMNFVVVGKSSKCLKQTIDLTAQWSPGHENFNSAFLAAFLSLCSKLCCCSRPSNDMQRRQSGKFRA